MKVICNVSSNNIGGIVNFLKGVSSSVERNSQFEFIGLEILKEKPFKSPHFNNFIKHEPFIYPNFFEKALFDDAKNYHQITEKLMPIIEWEKEIILKEKPDIILIYGTFWAPWCLLKAAEDLNVPVIHYYAGSLVLETTNYRKYQKKIFRRMEKDFHSYIIKTHIFPSQIARSRIENNVHEKKIINSVVIHSGIDTAHFFEKPETINKIGFVFRWTEVKNKEIVLNLGRMNHSKGEPLDFLLVSDIKETHYEYNEVKEYFTIIPPMDYPKLVEFYSSCSVIVSLSNFETFGNVPLESIYAGTPALINKNMGVAEVFDNLGLGEFVITTENTGKIYQKILDTQGKKIPENIRLEIREKYSYYHVVDKYCEILLSHSSKK